MRPLAFSVSPLTCVAPSRVSRLRPCCHTCQRFMPFYGQILLRGVKGPRLITRSVGGRLARSRSAAGVTRAAVNVLARVSVRSALLGVRPGAGLRSHVRVLCDVCCRIQARGSLPGWALGEGPRRVNTAAPVPLTPGHRIW